MTLRIYKDLWGMLSVMLAGLIPLSPRGSTYGVISMALLALAGCGTAWRPGRALRHPLPLACALFYLLELSGLLRTTHPGLAFYHAQTEASLLVFPLLYFGLPAGDRRWGARLMTALCLGLTLGSLYALGLALKNYLGSGDPAVFFYHRLVAPLGQHAVYYALYVFAGLVYLSGELRQGKKRGWPYMLWLLYFLLLIVLLRSKAVYAATLLFGVWQWLAMGTPERRTRRRWVAALLTGLLLSAAVFSTPLGQQFRLLGRTDLHLPLASRYNEGTYFNEVELRLLLWRFAAEILRDPSAWALGVGSGEAQALVDAKIRAYRLYTGRPGTDDQGYLHYNMHNQYMETLLRAGLCGLILLLAILAGAFRAARRAHSPWLPAILGAFALVACSESVLERQIGILPLFFFIGALWHFRAWAQPPGRHPLKIFVDAHVLDGAFQGSRSFLTGLYGLPWPGRFAVFVAARDLDALREAFPWLPEQQLIRYRFRRPLLRLALEIPWLLWKHGFDYAHVQYITPLFRHSRYIVTMHDALFLDYPEAFPRAYRLPRRWLFGRSLRLAELITVPSAYAGAQLRRHYGAGSCPWLLLPNGLDTAYARPAPEVAEAAARVREHYGASNYLLCVSRVEPRKNQELLLRAYLRLALYRRGIELVLIGARSLPHPALDEGLASLPGAAAALVRHVPQVPVEDLRCFYRAARVFVYPSKAEGFGIPPLEAAAMEAPLLCAHTGAMADYTFLGGQLFDPADEDAFCSKLVHILDNPPPEAARVALAQFVRKRYCWSRSAASLWQWLDSQGGSGQKSLSFHHRPPEATRETGYPIG